MEPQSSLPPLQETPSHFYFLKTHFNNILPSKPTFFKWFLAFLFSYENWAPSESLSLNTKQFNVGSNTGLETSNVKELRGE